MKRWSRAALGAMVLGAGLLGLTATHAGAQTFNSGSTGADGPFTPTCAPTPCTVTVALPPTGIFNFTTVTVPNGVTVRFTRNAANTPVLLLAQGPVIIEGLLDVSGEEGNYLFGRPGGGAPGGSDGGAGADGLTKEFGGFGLGPGGGGPGNGFTACGGGGGFGGGGAPGTGCTVCAPPIGVPGAGGPPYGTNTLRPILGGSGGGGGGSFLGRQRGGGGGGGGGAILLASSVSITLGTSSTDVIRANGGNGSSFSAGGGGGSGGAIRLIAPTISGNGTLLARGGGAGSFGTGGGPGGQGRIRLEATTFTYTGGTDPPATTGLPSPVFPGTGAPTLTIARVAGIPAPATPVGSVLGFPDILLPVGTTKPVEVVLSASQIPLGTTILVAATPQSGLRTSALSTGLAGSLASSTATASLTLNLNQTSVLTAAATFPLVASAAGAAPIYAEGEEVKWVRVAAILGGPSTLTYITVSGKEVPAERVERRW